MPSLSCTNVVMSEVQAQSPEGLETYTAFLFLGPQLKQAARADI